MEKQSPTWIFSARGIREDFRETISPMCREQAEKLMELSDRPAANEVEEKNHHRIREPSTPRGNATGGSVTLCLVDTCERQW